MCNVPDWSTVLPWQHFSPSEWGKKVERYVQIENSSYSRNIDIKYGWAWTGPCSLSKALIEIKRLSKLTSSIFRSGYKRSSDTDGDITAHILAKDDDNWVWFANGGQHRACVLAALGYEYMPIRVLKVIRRSEVVSWPNVVNRLFTVEQALRIFDHFYYDGSHPTVHRWNNYARKTYTKYL